MTRRIITCTAIAGLLLSLLLATQAQAQWTHHYPKLDDFGHHVYLEQHELPILAHGPVDPAPSPDGRSIAFAAQGWIWRMDLATGEARRLTDGAGVDGRPRWSADGSRLAFVRDHGGNTSIVLRDIESGNEQVIDTPALDLDPEFSADGRFLFYTSGESGSLELRRRHLEAGTDETLTDLEQVVRNARRLPGGDGVIYLHGNGAHRVLRERDFVEGYDRIAHAETLTYHLTADVHPTRRLIVYSAPIDNDYHLWTMDLDDPRVKHRLTDGSPYATTPAFSADGEYVYFVDLDDRRQFRLMRLPTYGGSPEPVEIEKWNYGAATGRLSLALTDGQGQPVTARVSVTAADGHPVAFSGDATYSDPQTGRHYFYVERNAEFTLPTGRYTVLAARGPMSQVAETQIRIRGDQQTEAELAISKIWDAGAADYVSADHHVHLNGDGHHRADHGDALRLMAGESLDQLAPMSWNRWERRVDREILGTETSRDGRTVHQGQEVRSHFHGHIGLLNVETPFAPWFFGPNNPTLGDPDRTNGEVFEFADRHGAFATYVHPIGTDRDPFAHLEDNPIPLELVSDGILAERMGIELVCAWTSPLGNAELWYRLLNIGRPIAAMSGTDGWVDFHRTPAMGTGRAYVRTGSSDTSAEAVIEAAAAGRSFLTTGPALVFELDDGARPGDVTDPGTRSWQATLASTTDIEVLEIIVNGNVVDRLDGVEAEEIRTLNGEIDLPAGGWIAARAYAGDQRQDSWPTMHARPFAHSSPIWIGEIGSTEPGARAAAAGDLTRAIDAAEKQALEAYGDVEINRMQTRFDEARARLADMVE
ncbi:MAG: CehA/McbA family metallohydrolase [Wenzhouxiangellaceae bacterium]|nr:CehA/McbA family metallohydrolase [Wenzhouxiangellaceae bacterium]MBS3823586.1 CehA/McbA family metallohydrolase [Wenzhouxiangellaceae bacterium]